MKNSIETNLVQSLANGFVLNASAEHTKRPFVMPKLTFVLPKLTRQGKLEQVTNATSSELGE